MLLTLCDECYPLPAVEELTVGIGLTACDNCKRRGKAPFMKRYRLRSILAVASLTPSFPPVVVVNTPAGSEPVIPTIVKP